MLVKKILSRPPKYHLDYINKKDEIYQRIEAIEILRNSSFNDYLRRQTYEWKMCITIWTPIVAFIGISLMNPYVWLPDYILWIASGVVLILHILWQRNLMKANETDRVKVRKYETHIISLLGLQETERCSGKFVYKHWSHYTYLSITLALLLVALFINSDLKRSILPLPNDIVAKLSENHPKNITARNEEIIKILRKKYNIKSKTP